MKRAATALREIVGLFVDDWRYAVATLIWIGFVAFSAKQYGLDPGARGIALAGGLIAILLGSLLVR